MIAYVRDGGGGASAQATFWGLIGVSAFVTPWVWRRVLALDRGGLATTIILGTNAIGAALPIFGHSPILLAISALVFGVAFFAVVGSTTAFVRLNYPPAEWPAGIAALTIAFGIGQTLGPIAVGAITDAVGSLSSALNVSAAMPEKTRSEFRDDGFFITGDLGKIDDKGYVHIVGRGKDLVISGGFNVYPKEIESEIDAM